MDKAILTQQLLQRRRNVLSPTYALHYDDPLTAVRAQGTTIWDENGKPYLDCYNNVPSVGHCHPHVLEAMQQQASLINTHSRYLHDNIVRYAERLTENLPPGLDMCTFVCTGTEANGLAYELAKAVTGNTGAIVTDGSYHGNMLAVSDLSLYRTRPSDQPDFVRAIPTPDLPSRISKGDSAVHGTDLAASTEPVIRALAGSQHGLAMLMIDPIFDAAGIYTAPPGYLMELARIIRDAGALVVVDEIQSGLTRLGDNMWGFMDSGIVPDIVTMGKPMGAGYPLAVVAARREIFEAFADRRGFFNTFGGTPVAGAVGNAVLDVIEQESIQKSVHDVGGFLLSGLHELKEQFDFVGDVRGKGLFIGVELMKDQETRTPDPVTASKLVRDMRHRGVLISACGKVDNVLKIRPPLVFSKDNANQLLDTLQDAFRAHEQGGRQ